MPRPLEVRTSATHPIRVDWLDAPAPVGMTLAPGVRDDSTEGFRWERDLDTDLRAIYATGARVLVCLLEDHEFGRYDIAELIPAARSHGFEVLRLAIVDGRVPARFEDVDELLDAMHARASEGARLVIHCRGGLGRTGTIAGCYLVRNGRSPADALAIVRRVRRSSRCPENPEQRSFIEQYARRIDMQRSAVAASERSTGASPRPWYATSWDELARVDPAVVARGDKAVVAEFLSVIEQEVAASPESSFTFMAAGDATLISAGRTFLAGTFRTPTIGELRSRIAGRQPTGGGRLVLSVLHGAHPMTDIGTLQATAPAGTVFQVASQFNCLEAPGPRIVPVRDYLHDSTQGPRASVSAFPGTLLRHYRAPAPDGSRFIQTDERCLDLLGDVFDSSIAELRSGYLRTSDVRDMPALAGALVDRFDSVRVGVHSGVEVVFGHDWAGPVPNPPRCISQVFTSTMALGGYSRDDGSGALVSTRRQLLRAAYLGTLLAALDLDSSAVVLTMIGGGAFGNAHRDIWDAIHWALAAVDPLFDGTKKVVVNTREPLADTDRARVRARGGAVIEFSGERIEVVR